MFLLLVFGVLDVFDGMHLVYVKTIETAKLIVIQTNAQINERGCVNLSFLCNSRLFAMELNDDDILAE